MHLPVRLCCRKHHRHRRPRRLRCRLQGLLGRCRVVRALALAAGVLVPSRRWQRCRQLLHRRRGRRCWRAVAALPLIQSQSLMRVSPGHRHRGLYPHCNRLCRLHRDSHVHAHHHCRSARWLPVHERRPCPYHSHRRIHGQTQSPTLCRTGPFRSLVNCHRRRYQLLYRRQCRSRRSAHSNHHSRRRPH